MNYGSEIWGYRSYQKLETVLNRFLKAYLGTVKTTPTSMILGDCGMYPLQISRKVNMVRYFYKLIMLPRDRLLWKVFQYDHDHAMKGTWCKDIKCILNESDMNGVYDSMDGWTVTSLTQTVKQKLCDNYETV